ncbi:MAG: hypothetical protein R3C59_05080 [Planctomycetaceae bacterium]
MLTRTATVTALLWCLLAGSDSATAQHVPGYHQPLSQHSPPGQTAAWFNALRNYDPTWLQPLLIQVPGGGQVDVYSGSAEAIGGEWSPVLVAVNAGHVYRLRISNMPQYPGFEIYPTVELIDHLHPPIGREDEFPIPIVLTEKDLKLAEAGQLVTRVIYLEQPQLAQQLDPLHREIPQSVEPQDNALWEADRLGRPMAVIRIGGRRPSANSPPSYYGTGGRVQMRQYVEHVPTEEKFVRGRSPVRRTSFERSPTPLRR